MTTAPVRYEPAKGTWYATGSHMDRVEFGRTWAARLAVVHALGIAPWLMLTDQQADDAVRAEARRPGAGDVFARSLFVRGAA